MSYNSKIILCKGIKIDREYVNVLSYTEQQMLNLCNSEGIKINEASNYTFIDRNKKLRVAFPYSQCVQANYIAFQNPDYSNKWFFAFIDNVEFKGNMNTEISFTIDAWSTWFDYWQKKTCFIERQHVNNDEIGLHTVPENLDVGEIIQEDFDEDSSYSTAFGFWIAIAGAWQPDDNSHATINPVKEGKQFNGVTVYNKQVFGNQLFLFEINRLSDFTNVGLFIQRTNRDGYIGDIKDMFVIPDAIVDRTIIQQHTAYTTMNDDYPFTFYTSSYSDTVKTFLTTITKQYTFSDYTPKNNKCFCYPTNYLLVSNNNGNTNIFKYEDFNTENCVFENQLAIGIGVSGRLVPKNYKKMITADDESIPLGKYPTCGWSADSYTNWLTQQAVNIPTQIANSLTPQINTDKNTGKSNLDFTNNVLSVASEIAGEIGSFYSASLLPNIQGGGNTGDVVFGAGKNCFTFRKMRSKTEYMKIIDDYYTRFGYAIKCLELPNIVGRQYWNYIQIGNSEEIGYGDTPTNFMETINNACRRGVTIWHNHSNVGNYNLNNSIVS